jgi:hypothetical protein
MNFLDAAFELCSLGWKVFPVAAGDKVPAITKKNGGRGVLDATDDEETIGDWARRFPHANVGVACGIPSGLLVVDVDAGNGGIESMRKLGSQSLRLPPTVTARTANGGFHAYFRYVAGPKNSKSLLAKGVDIRTTGGYVVAPPSVLSGGRGYHWARRPLGGDLPALPGWALERLKPREESPFYREPGGDGGDVGHLVDYLRAAPEGERNAILFWCACRLAEENCGGSEEKAALVEAAVSIGLTRSEALKTVNSGLRRGGRGR